MGITLKPSTVTISQHKLRLYLELKAKAKEYEVLKEELVGLLEIKTPVQKGPITAVIEYKSGSSTAWKQEFIRVASEEVAKKIMAKNKGNTASKHLVVVDIRD